MSGRFEDFVFIMNNIGKLSVHSNKFAKGSASRIFKKFNKCLVYVTKVNIFVKFLRSESRVYICMRRS